MWCNNVFIQATLVNYKCSSYLAIKYHCSNFTLCIKSTYYLISSFILIFLMRLLNWFFLIKNRFGFLGMAVIACLKKTTHIRVSETIGKSDNLMMLLCSCLKQKIRPKIFLFCRFEMSSKMSILPCNLRKKN